MSTGTWVTIYWVGTAIAAVWCIASTVKLVRETGDPGLAGAGVILVLAWPLVIPMALVVGGCEWFARWLRVKRNRPWPQPFFGKVDEEWL